jgi:hypothetical protein
MGLKMATNDVSATSQAKQDIERLLSIVAGFAAEAGIDVDELAAMAIAAVENNGKERDTIVATISDASIGLDHVDFLSYMLTLWNQDPRYVDEVGDSMAIPETGPSPSLQDLFQGALEGSLPLSSPMTFERATQLLKKHKAIVATDDGLWFAPSVLFRSNTRDRTGMAQQIRYLRDFGDTMYHNVFSPESVEERRFQYVTQVRGFPVANIPILNRVVQDEGLQFLRRVDDLLVNERVANLSMNGEKNCVGVGVYFYQRPD